MSKYTWLKNSIPYFLLLLIPLVLIIPSIGWINYSPGSEFSDLAITHLPNANFIKHTILVDHQIPLWNPLIMSGYPFAGDPLSGLWYPPGWLALLLPLPLGINLITALHIGVGAIGLFLLIKKLAVRWEIALIIGVCFTLLPKIYAHYGAGHITYLYAVCLTPWLMWSEARQYEGKSYFCKLNIVLSGLIILADMRWFPFALIAWWSIAAIIRIGNSSKRGETNHGTFIEVRRIIGRLAAELFISLLIAAPLLLPFMEFLVRSTRINMSGGENLLYSLPPRRLLGLILPPEGGFPEWIIYPGVGIIFLVIISLSTRKWKILLPAGIFIFTLIWSLGNNVSIIGLLESLPGLNLIRVPPRIAFLGDIMAIIGAALNLDWILHLSDDKAKKQINLIIIGTCLFMILFGVGIGILQGRFNNSVLRLLILTPCFAGTIIMVLKNKQKMIPTILLGVVLVIDLYLTDITLFGPSKLQNPHGAKAVETLNFDKSRFRVYSPTYSLGQEVAEENGLQLVQGVNPMQLASYVKYLEKATNIQYDKYSVVIPPLVEPNTESDKKSRTIGEMNTKYLTELNVKYLLFDSPLIEANGWNLISSTEDQWLYENQTITTRAGTLQSTTEQITKGVSITKYSPNEVIISINQPEKIILKLRDINYPGWRVWVDGIEKTIDECGIFRCVQLPLNTNQVIFKYQPISLYIGLFISILLILMVFFLKNQQYED
jgi:hypothetical protein